MHRRTEILMVCFALVLLTCMPVNAEDKHDETPVVPLCEALAALGAGDVSLVVLRGVIHWGPEMVVFYDPAQPRCHLDVQPSTLIEIPAGRPDLEPLTLFLREKGKAVVTIQGLLHGPQTIAGDILTLPALVAFSRRVSHRRYGHRGTFRTKLVVESVLDFAPAPDGEVSPFVVVKPIGEGSELPRLQDLSLPRYPEKARIAGLTGDVRIAVQIEDGVVAAARVVAGDRLLHDETIKSVQSWVFSDSLTSELDVTFSYRLERYPANSANEVRVEFSLPYRVLVVAPAYGW